MIYVSRRLIITCLLLLIACVIAGVWGLRSGAVTLETSQVFAALMGDTPRSMTMVVTEWRLPRVLMALLIGAALGVSGAEYDAWLIRIGEGDQFSSGFVEINPNSKIPALSDHSTTPPTRVFESGNILLYLAEKFGFFLPKDPAGRTETLNWLFWLQGAAPFLGGGFGHFYNYAPVKIEYAIDRFTMEAKRQLDVLDKQLARGRYVAGEEYTIADMAVWPWYGNVVLGNVYNAAEFLDAGSYKNVLRWAQDVGNRPAVKRGRIVNRTNGPLNEQLHERHDARDFDTQTEDKRQA